MKQLHRIARNHRSHWVGDGFPVRTLFSYATPDAVTSPFLLLDYAGPAEFSPASRPRGVGFHPHRGFETVTLLYHGEVEHRDTAGNGGRLGPGDVQWMTAARGLLHEEMHSEAFTRQGGLFEAVQLWVNLPAQNKMDSPHYQSIAKADIPVLQLDDKGSQLRVIAGRFQGVEGPARTYTPIHLWELRLTAGQSMELDLPEHTTTILFALKGGVEINHSALLSDVEAAFFDTSGRAIILRAHKDTMLLIMNGEPIDEPIAGYGPFVMNTQEEIQQALKDFNYPDY
ncbi:MAG: pirin family protein [Gammaproteobacteria bacterium]